MTKKGKVRRWARSFAMALIASVIVNVLGLLVYKPLFRVGKVPGDSLEWEKPWNVGNCSGRSATMAVILKVGLPAAIQMVVVNLSYLLITGMLNTFGVSAAAAPASD